ncbi:MAG TPA: bifunctional YncE family protein/alkaline phosphatase family protein [Gemmataceae bacterium]|nr:bifunctional YncE family protein/alkaline phosphatase family protein [Gemmataceae bacterium]
MRTVPLRTILLAALVMAGTTRADEPDTLKVGVQPDGRIVVPTNQILDPAGRQITFPGRPVDLALAEDGRVLVVKCNRTLEFIDLASGKVKQSLPLPSGVIDPKPGFGVVGLIVRGDRVYAGDAQNMVRVAERQASGRYALAEKHVELMKPRVGGAADPAGMALLAGDEMMVTSTRGNTVQVVNLATGQAEQAAGVGVAPFAVLPVGPGRVYVSNWGGDPPSAGDAQGVSSGTPVRIDPRTGVANHGTVSVVAALPGKWKQVKTIEVGLHPCAMAASPRGRFVYVANAASDTVSVIDRRTDTVVETIAIRPEGRLPFGSGPNALAVSPDGGTLYVANGTNNCLAVVRLGTIGFDADPGDGRPEKSAVVGLIPTGWYPGAVVLSPDGKTLYVANVKGHGSLSQPRPKLLGKQTYDYLGSVSVIPVPDAARLAKYTATVNANNRLAHSLAGLEKPRPDAKPLPVPARHGEPSVIKHVIYVIKENRTYDQLLGDMKEGDGDPNLVMFGEDVTPNHHRLAREFTLFDNFYCSGVLSADGHTWVNEAYVSDYLERTFGGFTRSSPDDGSDPLAYVPTGFLWDNALARKKTFRNYGEYVKTTYLPEKSTWAEWYAEHKAPGTHPRLKAAAKANIKSLEPYTHPSYPWFPLLMPDVSRARLFIDELKEFEKKGEFPNLVYMTLPCDHTTATKPGFPTPRASVADNDLALGRIVEAVSHSKFWPETCIFVVEDDPQNGFDHVDGHRTVALVISPYTKRKYVDHTNYNQTGMVKTIELVLGLPPMNQLDLSATAMRNCFDSRPDPAPYVCVPNRVALDEMNPPLNKLQGKALDWARKSLALDLDEADEADEDTLNRILWHATRGDAPYPERYVGRGED